MTAQSMVEVFAAAFDDVAAGWVLLLTERSELGGQLRDVGNFYVLSKHVWFPTTTRIVR